MTTVAIISQKGGAGKTTLALHLAVAAQDAGRVSLIIDTDPQATASQWGSWREDKPPEVIDSPPPRLAAKVEQAQEQGAQFVVIDTPPHADSAARAAVETARSGRLKGPLFASFPTSACCPSALDADQFGQHFVGRGDDL